MIKVHASLLPHPPRHTWPTTATKLPRSVAEGAEPERVGVGGTAPGETITRPPPSVVYATAAQFILAARRVGWQLGFASTVKADEAAAAALAALVGTATGS